LSNPFDTDTKTEEPVVDPENGWTADEAAAVGSTEELDEIDTPEALDDEAEDTVTPEAAATAGEGAKPEKAPKAPARPTPPEGLITRLTGNLNRVTPTEFAVFQKVYGPDEGLNVNDEYVVRMAAPWDGPVRVVDRTPRSFRLATLAGHLEAGQIEFRAEPSDVGLRFEIESWACSGDRLSNLLYHRLRMAKEIQLHMWTSFLERVARESGGRMTGGIDIHTRRVEDGAA